MNETLPSMPMVTFWLVVCPSGSSAVTRIWEEPLWRPVTISMSRSVPPTETAIFEEDWRMAA